jgi:hypothetical protein
MSGGSGGPIIIHGGHAALSNPIVHGQLPDEIKAMIDPILAKQGSDWTYCDKVCIGYAFTWALCHLG